jgi:hypothetical protein
MDNSEAVQRLDDLERFLSDRETDPSCEPLVLKAATDGRNRRPEDIHAEESAIRLLAKAPNGREIGNVQIGEEFDFMFDGLLGGFEGFGFHSVDLHVARVLNEVDVAKAASPDSLDHSVVADPAIRSKLRPEH